MSTSPLLNQSKEIRKNLRQQRRKLNVFQQKQTETKIKNLITRHPQFKYSDKIGLYLHAFGEVHTRLIIEYCFKLGKTVFLPMICNMNNKLLWVKVSQHQYRNNQFSKHSLGMLQPIASRGSPVSELDLLIMPLLACDLNGTRMGMGGGFYDRTLANTSNKPYRLGLAHDFQLLENRLTRNFWDQALDGLLTPSRKLTFKRKG